LATETPDTLVGLGLLLIAAVTLVWGLASVASAYAERGRPDLPRWHPRRWVAPCFAWWLGLFLVIADAGIYAILGWGTLRSAEGVELWGLLYVLACTGIAVAAFVSWARERWGGA